MDFSEYIDKKIEDWHAAQRHGCMCLVSKNPLCFYCRNQFEAPLAEYIERHAQIWRDTYSNTHDDFDRAIKDLF